MRDLQQLAALNDVFDGAGVIHVDENDQDAVQGRFEREERRAAVAQIGGGSGGRHGENIGRALNPPPVEPPPELPVETEEQAQERAWLKLKGVPEQPAPVGVGRPAREFPG